MKKYFIIIFISIFLGALAALGYFLVKTGALNTFNHSFKSSETQSQPVSQTKSFQGALANTLREIQEKAADAQEAIAEAVPNPFADRSTLTENKTAPAESSFSFAILGDTQYFSLNKPNGNFQQAMASVRRLNPDKIFAVGDLVGNCRAYDECSKDYTNWKNIVGNFMSKTYATQGNHDRTGGNKTDNIWRTSFNFPTNGPSGFSEQAYSFDYDNSHFVILDSDKPKEHLINGDQRAWLEKDLAANNKENAFVFFHEPSFPVSSKVGESLDKNAGERNALWQIFDKYNVTGVFNGHEHIVSRRKIDSKVFPQAKNSIYQFVFGDTDSFDHDLPDPGIAEYSNKGQGGFGFVKVNGKEITVEVHGPDGSLLDTFTFSK
jgi:hypothetical protein